jgi:hypothetical protein
MITLKERIKNKGLNNPKLAKQIGCKPVEIWRLANWPEKGGRKMTPEWAAKLAKHLDCRPSELLFSDGDGPGVHPSERVSPQNAIEIRGTVARNKWFILKDEKPEENSAIPQIGGKYGGFPQYAFRNGNLIKGYEAILLNNFDICVDYGMVRKSPLSFDTVIVEATKGEFTERTIRGIAMTKTGEFKLTHMFPDLGTLGDEPEIPPGQTEFFYDDKHIKIVGLVIASLNFFE